MFVCTKPRDHIRLQLVREGDKRVKFVKPLDPHSFKAKHSIR